ncbi:hypothetical protein [Martelella mediterranea]|uniref:hypothetical protein n=1 Tax=Martelella mediterranea TaxID=293089 RepID=UPI00036764D2|nr:hypothetical protein [Martelella mediterranea]
MSDLRRGLQTVADDANGILVFALLLSIAATVSPGRSANQTKCENLRWPLFQDVRLTTR